ncbi:MAG: porin family protein [Gallionella sp.]
MIPNLAAGATTNSGVKTMKCVISAVLLNFAIATPVLAADTGLYMGAKFGTVNYDYSYASNNSQAGYGLLLGYTVNRSLAVEAEFSRIGGFDDNPGSGVIKGKAFGFSGVGCLPINRDISLFGKMGIVSTTLDDSPQPGIPGRSYSDSFTGFNFGLGVQFTAGDATAIRFAFDSYPVAHITTANASSANMMYIAALVNF